MSVVRVTCIHDFRANALSTSQATTAYNLGGVGPGESVYGGFHLTAGYDSADRLLVGTLQAASCSGFIGASVNAIAFTCSTAFSGAPGSTWGSATTGTVASTDRVWWRGSYVMSTAITTGGTWRGLLEMGIR